MRSIINVLTAGATAAVLISGISLAQSAPEEITVQARRITSTTVTGRTASGIPIVDVSLSYGVSAEGLDLATNSGATALGDRVKDAAAAACKEIGQKYPDSTPNEAECARDATHRAMVRVNELVTSAEKSAKAAKSGK